MPGESQLAPLLGLMQGLLSRHIPGNGVVNLDLPLVAAGISPDGHSWIPIFCEITQQISNGQIYSRRGFLTVWGFQVAI